MAGLGEEPQTWAKTTGMDRRRDWFVLPPKPSFRLWTKQVLGIRL